MVDILVPILVSILTGVSTGLLTCFFAFQQFKEKHVFLSKEERYKELILKLSAFYGETATAENKKEFFIEYYKSWLYASPPVLRALKDIIESVTIKENNSILPLPSETRKSLLSSVVIAIRKDVGISSEDLSNDFFQYTGVISSSSKNNK